MAKQVVVNRQRRRKVRLCISYGTLVRRDNDRSYGVTSPSGEAGVVVVTESRLACNL